MNKNWKEEKCKTKINGAKQIQKGIGFRNKSISKK
jgi:hypothetical protein